MMRPLPISSATMRKILFAGASALALFLLATATLVLEGLDDRLAPAT